MKKSKLIIFTLVLSISLTSVTFADTLKVGSKGAEVTKLQAQLKQLGYFKAEATGHFGSITKEAVKDYQAQKGLAVDGIFGANTAKALYNTGTSSRSAERKAQTTADKETLKRVQTILKKMGLYKGSIDGLFGNMTETAVREFQKKYAMKATGIVDRETEIKILNHYAATAVSSRGGSNASDSKTTRIAAVNSNKEEEQLLNSDTEETVSEAEANYKDEPDSSEMFEGEEAETEPDAAESEELSAEETDERVAEGESIGKIEVLDWWTEANKVFALGSIAKVIDVRTGKSFNVKRTYGRNHADSEALTKADTKIIKEIWGGDFSWSRRPVIVQIKGRFLAASMASMPHAGLDNKPVNATVSNRSAGYGRGTNLDAVKNNGMDGHFDIHFKNSRTHGTNRVDPAHQKAVKEAAAAKL